MNRVTTQAALACLLIASTCAQAGAYSAMVVFGDSLSDAGQRPEAGLPSNPVRHTNRVGPSYGPGETYGLTSPMLINQRLGLAPQLASTNVVRALSGLPDGDNWAVGGYRTEQIYNSITSQFDPLTGIGGSQVRAGLTYADPLLRQRDGYLVNLRNLGLGIDPDTLFYLNGGGNDFLQGLVVDAAGARAAADRLAAGARALQAAGGRYFMLPLLVDVPSPVTGGLLNPAQQALAGVFNAELVTQLGAMDAEVIPLNVPLLYREVLAAPAAFGFDPAQNLLGTCFAGCGAAVNPVHGLGSANPDPDRLIYADIVHPTTAMQQILADQGYSILAAPWEIGLLPQAAGSAQNAMRQRLRQQWRGDWGQWQDVEQWRGFVDAGARRESFDGSGWSASGDGQAHGLFMGASYRAREDWRLGASLDVQEQRLELGESDSEYDLRSYLAGAFVQYHDGLLWGDLALEAGYLDYHSLERRFALGRTTRSERGDSAGRLLALGGRLGVELELADPQLRLAPFVSADYRHGELDGYREEGASSTALDYGRQRDRSRRLGAGLQLSHALPGGGALLGEIAREKEYEDDPREVEMALNSVAGVEFALQAPRAQRHLTRAALGLRQPLASGLALQAGYDYQRSADGHAQGASLALVLDW